MVTPPLLPNQMKTFGKLILALALASITAMGVSWFPEGDQPKPGDNDQRSLQKINNLLYTGSGSAGAATASATLLSWNSGEGSLTEDGAFVGTIIGVTGAYAQRATILAPESNTGTVSIGPSDAGSVRDLSPGQEYVIEMPSGTKFALDNWIAFSTVVGDKISVHYAN